MEIEHRKEAFQELGKRIREFVNSGFPDDKSQLISAVDQSVNDNAWFTTDTVFYMLASIAESLHPDQIEKWLDRYSFPGNEQPGNIAVVMAGNIPAVGFHDLLSVLMAGHNLQAKLSHDDKHMLPAITAVLAEIEPRFKERIVYTEENIKGFDAVIATGSNNTSRYFEYYFGKYPHIFRKNRNGVAVITGREGHKELTALGEDIFRFYGLGCRNVSKLFVPRNYDVKILLDALEGYAWAGEHHKYNNNYDYNKSIFLVNGDEHFDNGFLLLKEDTAIASPVSVLHFEIYDDVQHVNQILESQAEHIQCVVSADKDIPNSIPPGTSQHPKLWDYADGIDTMDFLLKL